MKIRQFATQVWLPARPQDVFPFFTDAANLNELTPPWLQFKILTPLPIEMKSGTRIRYKLKIHYVPVHWEACIKGWNPPHSFEDEQLRGPYTIWQHHHAFEPKNGGTLARDSVTYATPLDYLVHDRLVRPEIEEIFAYRAQVLRDRFDQLSQAN